MSQEKRTDKYKKDSTLEKYLSEMNRRLAGLDDDIQDTAGASSFPVLIITGAPRSGTTFLSQLIINNFDVSYPSNFIARFWESPVLGTALYRSMFPTREKVSWSSDIGYTEGPHGPHEFGYFWKKYLGENPQPTLLSKKLSQLTGFTGGPWLFKNLHYVPYRINDIYQAFPRAYFIHLERGIISNAVSIFEARKKLYGHTDAWLGPKPPTDPPLDTRSPVEQVLLQIEHLNKEISRQFGNLPPSRYLRLDYNEMASDPGLTLQRITAMMPSLEKLDGSKWTLPAVKNKTEKQELRDLFMDKAKELHLNIEEAG